MKLIALLTSLMVIVGLQAQAEILNCDGRNQKTGHEVVGTCNNSSFTGHNTFNGYLVTGYCFPNGKLEAYDINTEDFVAGRCYRGGLPIKTQLSFSKEANDADETPDVAN